jgi:hypothetical protein
MRHRHLHPADLRARCRILASHQFNVHYRRSPTEPPINTLFSDPANPALALARARRYKEELSATLPVGRRPLIYAILPDGWSNEFVPDSFQFPDPSLTRVKLLKPVTGH